MPLPKTKARQADRSPTTQKRQDKLLPSNKERTVLRKIDARALSQAVDEFKYLGRSKFLKKYGFARSSKFYFLHKQHIYDTKSLVGASYFYATGEKLSNSGLSGGRQTLAAITAATNASGQFRGSKLFEDNLGELRNVLADFDRLPGNNWDVRGFGFSDWVQLQQYNTLHTGGLPGVYVVSTSGLKPLKMRMVDPRIVYIGETVNQTLSKRLHQFNQSLIGKGGHSGGDTLSGDYRNKKLWLSIRSFPLRPDLSNKSALSFRSAQIQLLEKLLIYQYVFTNDQYPIGNTARTGVPRHRPRTE
jgi:hypothetical protein